MKINRAIRVLLIAATVACSRSSAASPGTTAPEGHRGGALQESIDRIIRSASAPVWIRYQVPSNEPGATMCCVESLASSTSANFAKECCVTCHLEKESSHISNFGNDARTELQRDRFWVYVRAENREIRKIRTFSDGCRVEAGGVRVETLRDVDPAESVAWLATAALELHEERGDLPKSKRMKEGKQSQHAISAIALHRTARALPALESMVGSNHPEALRAHAAFWLGMKGGQRELGILQGLIETTDLTDLREQAISGIAQSNLPEATARLLALARKGSSPEVRRQAIFWLSQKAGEKAAAAVRNAVDDPDDDVREMAVFAVSQLPAAEGLPILIELATGHRSGTVRERAIFWLGQSEDPRAMDAIEKILMK